MMYLGNRQSMHVLANNISTFCVIPHHHLSVNDLKQKKCYGG